MINNRTKFQVFTPPIERIGSPEDHRPDQKRIKIPPNNQSEFYPKEQELPFSINSSPILVPLLLPPPLPSPPCTEPTMSGC